MSRFEEQGAIPALQFFGESRLLEMDDLFTSFYSAEIPLISPLRQKIHEIALLDKGQMTWKCKIFTYSPYEY